MVERPVIILGAGATKACGGPLTDEILPAALNGKMEYGVHVATQRYTDLCQSLGTFGKLLKLHGSLNWLYCEKCDRLDFFVTWGMSGGMRATKALDELYHTVPFDDAYSCRGTRCRDPACDGFVMPVLITPTFVKDYENPHVHSVWNEAEEVMRQADHAVIIGYSLPTGDVEMAMLMKRGLDHLKRDQITVVEYVQGDETRAVNERTKQSEHPVGQRYRAVLGPGLDWQPIGFAGWLREQEQVGNFRFNATARR